MISRWKSEFLENMTAAFEKKDSAKSDTVNTWELYAQIGQLKVENEFLKKKLQQTGNIDQRMQLVNPRSERKGLYI